ncbi:MAG: phage protease [Bacteroidales bacterium]|jgi:hypothetical protein|nr:phage protease [Bacteroidales bacterium]
MAYKKIEREFCLTDDSVNCYGYRLLTSGMLLDRFTPAIGLLMHNRDGGVAVRWEDFRIEGDKLYAKPVINESRFPDLAGEIEAGFYSAASVGKIVALELSDDESLKLEGQTGPTVTKWYPREVSIVDIPGNYNAIAKLYDENDNVMLDLTSTIDNGQLTIDNSNKNKFKKDLNMSKIEFTAAQLAMLNLADTATGDEISIRLKDLADKAGRTEQAEKDLADLKAETVKSQIADTLKKGMDARKLTKELADKLEKDYAGNPEGLKALVDSMPAYPSATAMMTPGTGVPANLPEKFSGKSFNDLYVGGLLSELKAQFPDYYEQLKKN